ncbi:MAG: hypothetical protein LBQ81_08635 [Zoogloeaceae bacterium]|jgi:hypothetical protein|nr:hypothetical protein [Zoogloeaceae bacterium]
MKLAELSNLIGEAAAAALFAERSGEAFKVPWSAARDCAFRRETLALVGESAYGLLVSFFGGQWLYLENASKAQRADKVRALVRAKIDACGGTQSYARVYAAVGREVGLTARWVKAIYNQADAPLSVSEAAASYPQLWNE